MVWRHSHRKEAQRMTGTAETAHDDGDDDEAEGLALFRQRRAEARAAIAALYGPRS